MADFNPQGESAYFLRSLTSILTLFQMDSWAVVRFLPGNPLQCEHKKTTLIEGSPSVAHATFIPRL